MHLILCGLPKSGKTTFGKLAAKKLARPFIDTDRWLENSYSKTCRELYQVVGDAQFRILERIELLKLQHHASAVVALGGGTLTDASNAKLVQSLGKLIYLKTEPSIIWKRLQMKALPAYLNPDCSEESFFALAEKRLGLYENTAHVILDTAYLNQYELIDKIITINGQ